jgi:hypothetical protein
MRSRYRGLDEILLDNPSGTVLHPIKKCKYRLLTKSYFVRASNTAIIQPQHSGVNYAKGVAEYADLRASEGRPVSLEAFSFFSLLIFIKPRVKG